jgi:hypothetical protein
MRIIVADTSILIDLDRAALLEQAVRGHPDQLAVPDFLYESELKQDGLGPRLVALGVDILELSPQELELAQTLRLAEPRLSLPDCAAYTCACRPQHMLLTGDGRLRQRSEAAQMECHGLLWLLDHLEAHGTPVRTLHAGLAALLEHPRCRLPRDDAAARLHRWRPD